jgi:predicted SAM-dependent methyltransferase
MNNINNKIRLHIGCGTVRKEGYINIDLRTDVDTVDLVADCFKNLPYKENSVDEIISFHLIEHMDEPTFKNRLIYWKSLLKEGGKLIAETPNLIGLTKRFIKVYEEEHRTRPGYVYGCHSKEGRVGLFNDNHLWGFSPESIKEYFENAGFKNVIVGEGTDYHMVQYVEPGYTIRCEGIK